MLTYHEYRYKKKKNYKNVPSSLGFFWIVNYNTYCFCSYWPHSEFVRKLHEIETAHILLTNTVIVFAYAFLCIQYCLACQQYLLILANGVTYFGQFIHCTTVNVP